ncbi:MAG: T9SS type A sorting domain-containing protein, partial [Bacteroidales bacterium]
FPPEILSYENNILSGTSAPNDTIEIFGSTGEQNANEYLTSTTTGPDSTWSVEVTTTYPYFIATATDMENNTSEMSGVVENPIVENGKSCEKAITLEIDTVSPVSEMFTTSDSVMWFKFIAIDSTCVINIKSVNDTTDFNVTDFFLYENNCDNLFEIGHSTYADSLSIYYSDLKSDSTYFIKVEFAETVSNSFIIKLINISTKQRQCPPVCPNIIQNGNFQIFDIIDNDFNNFDVGVNVCGWEVLTGSPDLYGLSGDSYVQLWAGEPEEDFLNFTEGIYNNNIRLCKNEKYILKLKCKKETNENIKLNVVFTHINNFTPDTSTIGGGGGSYPEFVQQNELEVFTFENFPIDYYENIEISFEQNENFDYDCILIYPTNYDDENFNPVNYIYINDVYLEKTEAYAGNDLTICQGESVNLSALGCEENSYSWSPVEGIVNPYSATIIASPGNTTNYIVTVTDNWGCTATDDVTVTVNKPDVVVGGNTGACIGENIELLEVGGDAISWSWSGPNGFTSSSSNPVINSATPGNAGTYYVTVTDEDGCTGSESLNVSISPNPTAIASSNSPVCVGDDLYLEETGGEGFIYQWSGPNNFDTGPSIEQNTTIPNVTQASTGIYTVTVTDVNGCTGSDDVYVNIKSIPTASFAITTCPVINTPLPIINTSDDANSYAWYVNNEYRDVAPDPDPDIILNEPGYHCIKLVATNECGSDTYSTVIYVNNDACACHTSFGGWVDYDYIDGYTIETGTNVTWASVETIYAEGNIYIENGASLTIGENQRVEFAPNGRLIVKAGGELYLEDNVVLTGINVLPQGKVVTPCSQMWQGIEVWGDNEHPQDVPSQGIIKILNASAKIEHAHIGILSGARNMDHICDPISNPNPFDEDKGSGIVFILGEETEFNNNGIGIKFLSRESLYTPDIFWNWDYIRGCNFTGGGLRDYHYSITHPNPYPNAQNPWAGYANEYMRTDVGIYIDGMVTLVNNCNFDNMQHGILSFDSKYNVLNSDFSNVKYGIKIDNTNLSMDGHEIAGCEFQNIPGVLNQEGYAMHITASTHDDIHDNTIGIGLLYLYKNYTGILLDNASSFKITENEFYKFQTGIKVINSGDGGGDIRAATSDMKPENLWWQGNIFTNCLYGIITSQKNHKLRLRCNKHDNNADYIYNNLDITEYVNWDNKGWLADQGRPTPQFTFFGIDKSQYPAGNEFFPKNNPDRKRIKSNHGSILIDDDPYLVYQLLFGNYTYFRHSSPDEVIPNVDNSVVPIILNIENAVEKDDNYISCPLPHFEPIELPDAEIDPSPYTMKLDSLQHAEDSLDVLYSEAKLMLDNGMTYPILDDIYGNTPAGKLRKTLLNNSPLSDTVLYALMDEYPLPHGSFKQVMEENLPVSYDLQPVFYQRMENIPQGIAQQLKKLQAYNPWGSSPAHYKQQIDRISMERQLYLNDLIIHLCDTVNQRRDLAIALLEAENTVHSKQLLIGTYMQDGDYALAAAKLSEIQDTLNQWKTLTTMLLDLYQANQSLYDLDSAQISYVRDLAYQCPATLASAQAKSILMYLYREYVPECPDDMGMKSMHQNNGNTNLTRGCCDNSSGLYLGDNYPDPADAFTEIPYLLPDGVSGIIKVHDPNGKLVETVSVDSKNQHIRLDTETWKPGMYLYSLDVKGKAPLTRKMMIK